MSGSVHFYFYKKALIPKLRIAAITRNYVYNYLTSCNQVFSLSSEFNLLAWN